MLAIRRVTLTYRGGCSWRFRILAFVAESIFLGSELARGGLVQRKEMNQLGPGG